MANQGSEVATLVAQNTFTTGLRTPKNTLASISVAGVVDSIITLQRRFAGPDSWAVPTAWNDLESWSANVEGSYQSDEECELRLGIKTGDYGSDTVICRVGFG